MDKPTDPTAASAELMDHSDVPDDFPQEFSAAVPGAQPKLLVHHNPDGRYVDTAASLRAERWAICVDLVEQLVDYVHKHATSGAAPAAYAKRVAAAVEHKRASWGISVLEAAWVREKLQARLPG